ncbi:hypothetical protein [Corynebacterium sp. HMSC29G08]|uniref:hypothetical protein n=1 Tax=Corynebacterium sp. HMSC29G08 TaxID=1581069 RepID=UPI0008A30BFD|nr:hypothetical protein [Corynebacterium sp. HMSC29G08]OFT84487.1 hypothetical protein HMPREF3101_04195 [Corynebacterium sp. HMSC29G08]
MRNIRTAAVAAATALTVALGGTTVAFAEETTENTTTTTDQQDNGSAKKEDNKGSAQKDSTKGDKAVIFVGKQEGDKDFGNVVSDGTKGLFGGKGSSKYFKDSDKEFYPTDAFGKKTRVEEVPQWARYWIDGTVVAGIGALVGMIIAAVNFASYNGWIKL